MKQYDVIIIGAGASGLFAGATAIQNGHTVAIIDMGATPARKVAVSGGGRCNFTNIISAKIKTLCVAHWRDFRPPTCWIGHKNTA